MPEYVYYVSGNIFVTANSREEADKIVKDNEHYGVSGWDLHHKLFALVVPINFSHVISSIQEER